MPDRSLSTDIQFLKGVGPRGAQGFRKAGIETVGDLLMRIPRRYEDRRHLPEIRTVQPGAWVTVRGRIRSLEARPTRGGMVILKAILSDGSGSMALTWFNQPWIKRSLEAHDGEIIAYGQVKDTGTWLEIGNPEWESISDAEDVEDFTRIIPVYPLVEGLAQKLFRRAVQNAIELYLDAVEDPFPEWLRKELRLQTLRWSLRQVHSPTDEKFRLEARKRLVFEEFFYNQIGLALRKANTAAEIGIAFPIRALLAGQDPEKQNRATSAEAGLRHAKQKLKRQPAGAAMPSHLFEEQAREALANEPLWDQIHRMLPFELTGAQKRVIEEIWHDMAEPHPMNRLVQGDVGSGKTAVAACAMLAAVRSGYQAALMAPTEILAEQHGQNLRRLFEPLGVSVELLIGKLGAKAKRAAVQRVESGEAQIVIGTHALIQESVTFRNLGLAVIDEQHRFGVLQRKALRDKGLGNPDVLVMTATPIPRTLTMTQYGDLSVSIIDELPPGRRPIKTHWKLPSERPSIYQGLKKMLTEGRQAYFVCPMVSESEKMLAQAAEDLHYRLQHEVYPELADRIGLIHGQMKAVEKEAVMEAFRAHKLDILVASTVIEVGVDVPNATMMVIEDANRFGLAQLHQLRGRVGRGSAQSYCVLIADGKGEYARERMEILVATNDGFKIAEADWELRGPGVIAGTQQSGNADYKIADLRLDGQLLEQARRAATDLVKRFPGLDHPELELIRERVEDQRSDLAAISVS